MARMQRRAALVAIWATGTVVAMALAVVAVGLAGSRITSRAVPVVSRDAVTEELATAGPTTTLAENGSALDLAGPVAGASGGSAGSAGSTGAGDPGLGVGTSAADPSGAAPAGSSGDAAAPPSTAAPGAAALVPPSALEPGDDGVTSNRSPGGSGGGSGSSPGGSGSSPGGSGSSPGGPAPTVATTTTTPPTSTRTITSPSGSIDVRCTGSTVTLLSTAPAPGYAAKVITASGQEVRVQLLDAKGKGSELRARCTNGVIDAQVQAK